MTRKDYNLVAETLRGNEVNMEPYAFEWLCRSFATRLANDNPRFDIDKFLLACGVD